jgi:hypothetical protein
MLMNSACGNSLLVKLSDSQLEEGGSIPTLPLQKRDWKVADAPLKAGQVLVKEHHYARGGSNTCCYMHGLYNLASEDLMGVAWWLPPTRVAAESVNKSEWKRVLSLTRLVILPGVPKNAASFLLAHSVRIIWKDNRFVSLVTYADESQGHLGQIYLAANWAYVGRTGPYPRWLDRYGTQVSQKATKNRVKSEMERLGHIKIGSFFKHKFVLHHPSLSVKPQD